MLKIGQNRIKIIRLLLDFLKSNSTALVPTYTVVAWGLQTSAQFTPGLVYRTILSCLEAEKLVEFNVYLQNFTSSRNSSAFINALPAAHAIFIYLQCPIKSLNFCAQHAC